MNAINYTSEDQLQKAISRLEKTQDQWRILSLEEKVKAMSEMANILLDKKSELARLAALEMGKPIKSGEMEIEKSARALKQIPNLWKTPQAPLEAQPFGIVFSIQPWNFPFWQVFRMCASAWTAGNVVLLKHSELVPQTAIEIEKLCRWSMGPLLQNVLLEPSRIHQLIEQEPRVRFVTFTGSTKVGRLIAETCGRSMKPGIFELGGNDAYLVCEDADLDLAAEKCAQTRLVNSGQSCVSGKRFFLHKSIKNQFLQKFEKSLQKFLWGSPLDGETDLGPLAHEKFKTQLKEQILKAQSEGAQFFAVKPTGEKVSLADFPPMGYLDFAQNWRAFEGEEIFGPVALIYEFEDFEEVNSAINRGPYGLAGGIFTQRRTLAQQAARMSQVGTFAWNEFCQSDPLYPFGGCKDSGFGREMGLIGIEQFVSWKVLRGF